MLPQVGDGIYFWGAYQKALFVHGAFFVLQNNDWNDRESYRVESYVNNRRG